MKNASLILLFCSFEVSVVIWCFQCQGPFGVVQRQALLCVAHYSAVEIITQPGLLADSRKSLSSTLTVLSVHSFPGEGSFPVPCTVLRPVVIMSLARLHLVCPTLYTCSKVQSHTAHRCHSLLPAAAEERGEEVGFRSSGVAVTSLTTD